MDLKLIEAALDRQSAAITRMAQRQPHTTYNHGPLWDMVDAAKKELRDAQQPGDLETSSNNCTVVVQFKSSDFRVGHYMEFPAKVLEKLREAGIPAVGDWMLREVEYGSLTISFYTPDNRVIYTWDSLGEEPEVDLADELI